ncbi:MAG: dihydroxyacetone kinase subunit DhaL [Planctomycetia bacterium]|nr:dihydroxyacetone kinase subunit DhaL [Planctomycetia bacterium]
MVEKVSLADLMARFRKAFQNIRDEVELLSKLDAATGDGDHGVTMVRIVDKAEDALNTKGVSDPAALFKSMGMGAMSAGGGSAGPLMGQFFIGLAGGIPENVEAMTAGDVAKLLESGYAGMYKFSKANVGDRTMMDALKPAVDALLEYSHTGTDIDEMLQRAAHAAKDGAQATEQMLAKFGRARNLGDRVLGNPDPGATSWSLIFRGLAEKN